MSKHMGEEAYRLLSTAPIWNRTLPRILGNEESQSVPSILVDVAVCVD